MSSNSTTSAPHAPPPGIDISSAVDGMFYGILISLALWGITIVQTWTYINNNKDKWFLRTLVGALFVLDTVTSGLTVKTAHFYFVENFGGLGAFLKVASELIAEVMVNVTIVYIVELFFAYRVYILNGRHWFLPAVIVFIGTLGFACGIILTVNDASIPTQAHLAVPSMKIEVALTNGLEALCDIVATISMSWYFHTGRGDIRQTNNVLEKLLMITVARGGLVTVAQLLTLILYVCQPTTLNWMPMHFCLCKLYSITFVFILNSRESLRGMLQPTISTSGMYTDTIRPSRGANSQNGVSSPNVNTFQLKTLTTDMANGEKAYA